MAAIVSVVASSCGLDVDGRWLSRTVTSATRVHRYAVFVPSGRPLEGGWPVLLYLHGADGRGTDGTTHTMREFGGWIRQNPGAFPLVAVLPQAESLLWTEEDAEIALAALDHTEREFQIDRDRVYLAGYSRGANGAWWVAYRNPTRFAAIWAASGWIDLEPRAPAPVVPAGDGAPWQAVARRLAGIPAWLVHGATDEVVPVAQSRTLAAALSSSGSTTRYSEVPGVGHDVWASMDAAESIEWLLSHRRTDRR